MSLDVRENFTEQSKALVHASVCFLSVRHWAIYRKSPKADLRMCLKGLLLAFRRHRVVYLLDLGHDSPCLLAQSSPRDSEIYGARLGVTFCSKGCPARSRKDAAPAWLPQQFSGCFVACSGTVQQSDGNVDAKNGEIRRTVIQQAR